MLNIAAQLANYMKAMPLQVILFHKLYEKMGRLHTALLHIETRRLSRGNIQARSVELRNKVSKYLQRNCECIVL